MPENRSSADSYVFAAIFVAIIFLPIIYLIWMFSSVKNFFVSWAVLIAALVGFAVFGA